MRGYALLFPLVVLATPAMAGGQSVNGQNREFRLLSQLNANPVAQPDRQLSQGTQTFKIVNASNPAFNGTSLEVFQQEIIGNKLVSFHSYGTTESPNGTDAYHWTVTNATGDVDGQHMKASGKFELTGGKGKFKNVKGGGEFSCEFGPNTKNGCDWNSQIEGVENM